jgi:hypothetical protein
VTGGRVKVHVNELAGKRSGGFLLVFFFSNIVSTRDAKEKFFVRRLLHLTVVSAAATALLRVSRPEQVYGERMRERERERERVRERERE